MNRKRLIKQHRKNQVTIFLMIAITTLLVNCSQTDQQNGHAGENTKASLQKNAAKKIVIEINNEQQFEKILNEGKIVLVDFYADWCGPCHMLKPTIAEVARQYLNDVSVVAINIDNFQSLARKFNVTAIPDVKVFKNGAVEATLVGVQPKASYTDAIEKLL